MKYMVLYCNHGVLATWCPKARWTFGGCWWLGAEVRPHWVWFVVLGLEVSIGRKRPCA